MAIIYVHDPDNLPCHNQNGLNAFRHKGPQIWSSLPNSIKGAISLTVSCYIIGMALNDNLCLVMWTMDDDKGWP